MLANLLVAQAAAASRDDDEPRDALPAVGPSFRDATRVAGANTAIWTDIYLVQQRRPDRGIDELRALSECALLAAGDAPACAWNERARTDREALLGAGWRADRCTSCAPRCRTARA